MFTAFKENCDFPDILAKSPSIKVHENLFSGSRVVKCGQRNGRTGG
jgi:hypothetical protein